MLKTIIVAMVLVACIQGTAFAVITEPFTTPENLTEQDNIFINFTTFGCHALIGVDPYVEYEPPNVLSFIASFYDGSPVCQPFIPLGEYAFPIGRLQQGTYQLNLVNAIYDGLKPVPVDFETLYTIEFTVGAARAIPATSLISTWILGISVIGIGVISIQHSRRASP